MKTGPWATGEGSARDRLAKPKGPLP